MVDLRSLVSADGAPDSLIFRVAAYRNDEMAELVRELTAIANQPSALPRLIVIGAEYDRDAGLGVFGVGEEVVRKLRQVVPVLARRAIEPEPIVTVTEQTLDGKSIALISVDACNDPPYLLKAWISDQMPAGSGWIKRGANCERLRRADLDEIYSSKPQITETVSAPRSAGAPFFPEIAASEVIVSFENGTSNSVAELEALPLTLLPSKVAAERLKKLLASRQKARMDAGSTNTHIQRLLNAQLFSSEGGFQEHSDETLNRMLLEAPNTHRQADDYYRYEERAHKLAVRIANRSAVRLPNCRLTLKLARTDGVGVSDRLYLRPHEDACAAVSYPSVTQTESSVIVTSKLVSIDAGASVAAFHKPPRLWLREAAAGRSLIAEYVLQSAVLPEPLSGRLEIRVLPARVDAIGLCPSLMTRR